MKLVLKTSTDTTHHSTVLFVLASHLSQRPDLAGYQHSAPAVPEQPYSVGRTCSLHHCYNICVLTSNNSTWVQVHYWIVLIKSLQSRTLNITRAKKMSVDLEHPFFAPAAHAGAGVYSLLCTNCRIIICRLNNSFRIKPWPKNISHTAHCCIHE